MKLTTADSWFSWCIRSRDNWTCQRCGKVYMPPTKSLHCMHGKGRGKWSTRFNPNNGITGCYGCHSYLDTHPIEKEAFFRNYFGDDICYDIALLSNRPAHGIKKKLKQIAKHYQSEFKRIEQLRKSGRTGVIEVKSYQLGD